MNRTSLFIIAFLFVTFGCTQKSGRLKVQVINHTFFQDLPSASGIEKYKGSTFIVGDDSPWLFVLDENNEMTKKVQLSAIDSMVNNRTPKGLKADFEAIEKLSINDVEHLMVISSGSSEITRDTAYLISATPKWTIAKRNLRPLYEEIKKAAHISGKDEINVEGIAIHTKNTYLLHRGNVSGNFIAVLDTDQLVNYISNASDYIPEVSVFYFDLPVYKNQKSGFSGACITPDGKNMLFTASLEETADVLNDGKVLGSFIGIIDLEKLAESKFEAKLVQEDGEVLPKKLEGITVKSWSKNKMNVLVACDNDDGSSDLFEMEVGF